MKGLTIVLLAAVLLTWILIFYLAYLWGISGLIALLFRDNNYITSSPEILEQGKLVELLIIREDQLKDEMVINRKLMKFGLSILIFSTFYVIYNLIYIFRCKCRKEN